MKSVPVKNIYYLLSYAWDKLDEAELTSAGVEDYEEMANLLGKVLANGCHYLFKRGLYRSYQETEAEIPGIRGKLLLQESVGALSFQNRRAWCQFDELTYNVLLNQILKSTVSRLLRMDRIDKVLYLDLKEIYQRLYGIDKIPLQRSSFQMVRIHRNNSFYGFLIQVCRLLFESTALNESNGRYQFRDFSRDHYQLARLFESFVFNFYERSQRRFKVHAPNFKWPFAPQNEDHSRLLPRMQTDIVLEDDERIIVIDTKFYSSTLAKREDYGSTSFKSENLYQLFAYMQHIPNEKGKRVDGILLYPDVGDTLHATYEWKGQQLTFKTVDLEQDWRGIEDELRELIGVHETMNTSV